MWILPSSEGLVPLSARMEHLPFFVRCREIPVDFPMLLIFMRDKVPEKQTRKMVFSPVKPTGKQESKDMLGPTLQI